jgi:hypothetical protein
VDARRGGLGRPLPPSLPSLPPPLLPARYNDWAGTAHQQSLIGSGRPSPRRGGGRGQLGRKERRAGADSDRRLAGHRRTEGREERGPGHRWKCGSQRGRAASAAPGQGMLRALAAQRSGESGSEAHVLSPSRGREDEEEEEKQEEDEGSHPGKRSAERSCRTRAEPGPSVPRGAQPRQ